MRKRVAKAVVLILTSVLYYSVFVHGKETPKNGIDQIGTKHKADNKPTSTHSQIKHKHNVDRIRESKKPDAASNCNSKISKDFPEGMDCSELDEACLSYDLDEKCRYGENMTIAFKVKKGVHCKGNTEFEQEVVCQYCYQTPKWQQNCASVKGCNSAAAPRPYYPVNCTVNSKVICLGPRSFSRNMPCNWKNGYRWSTTFILSVTLGGFGADRFYLGRWQEGIGKLFSFGGLGIWTIVDIALISVRYLGPGDGSLYID